MSRVRPWALAAGFAAGAVALALPSSLQEFGEFGSRPARAAAVGLAMAAWWLLEAMPMHWTSCVPIVAFPLLGVFGRGPAGDAAAAVAPYFDPYNFLFAGGMAIAAAIEQQGLHRRLALGVMNGIGTDPRRLLAGVLAATAFVSLWISNTATATMMLPIALALVAQLERREERRLGRYGMALMLAVAWGSNIGGIGTKIGTAPNAQLSGFLERSGTSVSFLQFALVGFPFVLMLLPAAWALLWRLGRADRPRQDAREVVRRELAALGRVGAAERGGGGGLLRHRRALDREPRADRRDLGADPGRRLGARRGRHRGRRGAPAARRSRPRRRPAARRSPRSAACRGRRCCFWAAASRSRPACRRAASRSGWRSGWPASPASRRSASSWSRR